MGRLKNSTSMFLLGLVIWLPTDSAWSQGASSPKETQASEVAGSEAPVRTTEEEIRELKRQLEELTQKVQALERQNDLAKEQAAEKAEKAKTAPVVTAGKDGFSLKSADNAFQLRVSGALGYDIAWFDQDRSLIDAVGDEQDGTGFRYGRFRVSGNVYDVIDYMAEFDFTGENGQDSPSLKDVYLQLRDIPYVGEHRGELRIGHFKEPISLEELMSVRYRTFMEKSLMNAFIPSRNPGMQWSDALLGEKNQERLTYQIGVFKNADDWPSSNDSDEDQGYIVTGRVTGLPIYREDGAQLLHLGVGYSHRNPDGAVMNWAARPESRLSLFRYVNAEGYPLFRLRDARADDVDLYNLELAGVWNRFALQGEYTLADVNTTFDGDRDFSGYYAQASYFLTDDFRAYRNSQGIFDRVRPKTNFGWKAEDGWGAWEVAARYSSVDLNDGGVRGGEQNAWTLGLNWYLNANTRIMWNYVRNSVDHDLYDGDFSIFETRFQVEF